MDDVANDPRRIDPSQLTPASADAAMIDSQAAYHLFSIIGKTAARNVKEGLLSEAINNPMVKKVVRYAYDPFITFGLTPPEYTPNESGRQFNDTDHNVWNLLDALAARNITGGNAIDLTRKLLESLSPKSAELVCMILKKDLRCGITEKTANKLVPGLIPTFDVMLAHKFEEKRVKVWPVAIEPKLDGVRVICIVKGGRAKFFSRTGKPFPAVDHLAPQVEKMVADAYDEAARSITKMHQFFVKYLTESVNQPGVVLDGEIVSGSFNKTVGDVRRKDEAALDAEYVIFDALPLKFFLSNTTLVIPVPYQVRRGVVELLEAHAGDNVRKTTCDQAHSALDVHDFYKSYRRDGLEGAIVKPLDAHYFKKRNHAWMKIKGEESEDLRVVSKFEGTGKYKGMLGGLIVERWSGTVNGMVAVRVGGGFSDEQRKEFWDNYDAVHERLIEVEYHEVTPDGSLRHPRFVRFRDDKDAAQAA